MPIGVLACLLTLILAIRLYGTSRGLPTVPVIALVALLDSATGTGLFIYRADQAPPFALAAVVLLILGSWLRRRLRPRPYRGPIALPDGWRDIHRPQRPRRWHDDEYAELDPDHPGPVQCSCPHSRHGRRR